MLIVLLNLALTSCSWFDSKPIEPKILGVSHLQYDAKSGLWIAEIDSTQYTVSEVTIPDNSSRSYHKIQYLTPSGDMEVTVFVSPHMRGVQAVLGKQSAEQIEEMYRENHTFGVIVLGFIALFVVSIGFSHGKKEKVTEAKSEA